MRKKSTEKRLIWGTPSGSQPAFACQLALRSSKIWKKHVHFQTFFVDFRREINKKGWKRLKKVVRPAFGCAQHPRAGRNTQHTIIVKTRQVYNLFQDIFDKTKARALRSTEVPSNLHFIKNIWMIGKLTVLSGTGDIYHSHYKNVELKIVFSGFPELNES